MNDRRRRVARPLGFTLLELGIVIGVSAILAAAIVPDLIETMRNKMAERASADVAVIHDAARLFYIENVVLPLRWPGELSAGQCNNTFVPGNATAQLLLGGYLAGGTGTNTPLLGSANFMMNPWGQAYDPVLYAPVGLVVARPACLFGIATNVPAAISEGFVSFLPQASCVVGACPPGIAAVPTGFVRCCSYVPKPGTAINGPCTTQVVCGGAFPYCRCQ